MQKQNVGCQDFFLSNKLTDEARHVLMNSTGVGEKVWKHLQPLAQPTGLGAMS